MADLPDALKSMTVKALRDLARKQLGAGYTKLKTKSQLVAALAKGIDGAVAKGLLAKLGGKAATAKPAAKVKGPPPPKGKAASPAKPTAKAASTAAVKASPIGKATPPAKPAPKAAAKPASAAKAAAPVGADTSLVRPERSRGTKPKPVAIFYDEQLGELPDRYEDDAFIALPVDPTTLFVYWDFNPRTTAAAASGLPAAHTVLSVHGDGQKVLEIDVALESRCFYVRNLAPGLSYHAEIDFVGSDGRRQRVGRPTNRVGVPHSGPATLVDDRFIAFPWEWKKASGASFASRPAPGAAQRDLAASGWRGGSSMPLRPWLAGGSLSGRPLGK